MPLVAVDLACIALACSSALAAMESAAAKPAKHLLNHYHTQKTYLDGGIASKAAGFAPPSCLHSSGGAVLAGLYD